MKNLFPEFAQLINDQFNSMGDQLFIVDVDRDEIWKIYIEGFLAEHNKIFRTKRFHDCSCCRYFIKNMGAVVSIENGEYRTIWDVEGPGYYSEVAKALSEFVKRHPIKNVFLSREPGYGTQKNVAIIEGTTYTFNHFWCKIPKNLVNRDPGPKLSNAESSHQVLGRGLRELTLDSFDTALELIDQGSLYRGQEFRAAISEFRNLKVNFDGLDDKERDIFVWSNINSPAARIRNTAIGTFLQDVSEGTKDLDGCLRSYEVVMAPSNYKRPTATVTKGMIDKALKTIQEMDIEDSLYRRHATIEDISANDVLFVDRSLKTKLKGVASIISVDQIITQKQLSKIEEISIDDFIDNVLPTTTSLEVMVENKHAPNFCNILAPMNEDSKPLFKWGSNFSWSYTGNITDSMKENVKKFGGKVDGVLRFSIQWNDKSDNHNDLDAHCIQPVPHEEIYFRKKIGHLSTGSLDVDIIRPQGLAVENIVFTDVNRMKNGVYQFFVDNYSGTSGENFSAEIEFGNTIYSYRYEGRTKGKMYVADVTLKDGRFSIVHKMPHGEQSKDIYGLKTQAFHKVNLVTTSPNYWRDNAVGNKHFMFILDGCKNPEKTRGFYNEFLDNSLAEHRKVFEVLSGKMQCEYGDKQLAGLGFSSTKRAELVVRANGATSRLLKVKV